MTDDDALLATLGDDPGLVVEVAVGHEGWRHGEITLVVDGGDVVNVRQRRSGREREWQGRLEPERLHTLGNRLAELGREPTAPRAGAVDPDDDPVRLIVRRDGAKLRESQLRHSQRFRDPSLDGVLTAWQQAVEDVTAGELPYGADGA
jgi:hypothetical protein